MLTYRIKSKLIHASFDQLLEALNVKQVKKLRDKVAEYLPGLFLNHLPPIYDLHPSEIKCTGVDTISTTPWYEQILKPSRGELPEDHAKNF